MKTYKVKTIELHVNEKVHYINAESRESAMLAARQRNLEYGTAYVIDSEPDNFTGEVVKTKILSCKVHIHDLT